MIPLRNRSPNLGHFRNLGVSNGKSPGFVVSNGAAELLPLLQQSFQSCGSKTRSVVLTGKPLGFRKGKSMRTEARTRECVVSSGPLLKVQKYENVHSIYSITCSISSILIHLLPPKRNPGAVYSIHSIGAPLIGISSHRAFQLVVIKPAIHTYIHASMHPCIHTYIHASMHTYIHASMHTYIHTYILTFLLSYFLTFLLTIHTYHALPYLTFTFTLHYITVHYITLHSYICIYTCYIWVYFFRIWAQDDGLLRSILVMNLPISNVSNFDQ